MVLISDSEFDHVIASAAHCMTPGGSVVDVRQGG